MNARKLIAVLVAIKYLYFGVTCRFCCPLKRPQGFVSGPLLAYHQPKYA